MDVCGESRFPHKRGVIRSRFHGLTRALLRVDTDTVTTSNRKFLYRFVMFFALANTLPAQPANLKNFFHFAGLQYGDSVDKAIQIYGQPAKHDSSGQLLNHMEYDQGLTISYYVKSGKVASIQLYDKPSVLPLIRSKAGDDPNLKYFGMSWPALSAAFGKEYTEKTQGAFTYFQYSIQDGDKSGLLKFWCKPPGKWDRCRIDVQWFLK